MTWGDYKRADKKSSGGDNSGENRGGVKTEQAKKGPA
jgi:hypothetical protein